MSSNFKEVLGGLLESKHPMYYIFLEISGENQLLDEDSSYHDQMLINLV